MGKQETEMLKGTLEGIVLAFLSGRPARAKALGRLIERMKSLDGLWITTVGEVARHTASLNLAPRTCPQPVLPADAHWVARPD